MTSRSLLLLLCFCTPVRSSFAGPAVPTAKITGTVTDFQDVPISGAEVKVKDADFGDVAVASTDARGAFELTVAKGRYMALYACKDYSVKNLEYWSWDLKADEDLVINPRIDGLEVYALNAFMIQRVPSSMQIYFRPMSLKRVAQAGGKERLKDAAFADIAPRLAAPDVDAFINGERVQILALNQVKESAVSTKQGIGAYLMQTSLPKDQAGKVWRICVTVRDSETREQGESCLSWEKPIYTEE